MFEALIVVSRYQSDQTPRVQFRANAIEYPLFYLLCFYLFVSLGFWLLFFRVLVPIIFGKWLIAFTLKPQSLTHLARYTTEIHRGITSWICLKKSIYLNTWSMNISQNRLNLLHWQCPKRFSHTFLSVFYMREKFIK